MTDFEVVQTEEAVDDHDRPWILDDDAGIGAGQFQATYPSQTRVLRVWWRFQSTQGMLRALASILTPGEVAWTCEYLRRAWVDAYRGQPDVYVLRDDGERVVSVPNLCRVLGLDPSVWADEISRAL